LISSPSSSQSLTVGMTGASGFIGSSLAAALTTVPGIRLIRFRRKDPSGLPAPAAFRELVQESDVIYHLAGVNRGTVDEILSGNIQFTSNLAEAARKWGKSSLRIIFISSMQVYRQPSHGKGLRESSPVEPSTIYGIAKHTAENLLRVSGRPLTILRASNTYGPGCRPRYNSVIATWCEMAVQGRPLSVDGDGSQKRDFVYIDDVVGALVLAGTRLQKQRLKVFNLGYGKAHSLKQVVAEINRVYPDVELEFRNNADPGDADYFCDSTRFRKQLDWKPQMTLKKGIPLTLKWFEERGKRA